MTWVKLDDGFPEHPKVAAAGPVAGWMLVAAIAYCNRQLTDGFVPYKVARTLVDFDGIQADGHPVDWEWAALELVHIGLWERVRGGYAIHDFLDYQPSKEQVLKERGQAAERMKKMRIRKKESYAVTSPEVRSPRTPKNKRTSKEQEVLLSAAEKKPRQLLWDALVLALYGPEWKPTTTERGRLNKAIKELLEVGATPDQVGVRCAEYRRKYQDAALTPQALTGNWSSLGGVNGNGSVPSTAAERYRQEDLQRSKEMAARLLGSPL